MFDYNIHGTHVSQSYKVILISKTNTAKQLIGNGRGSIVFIGTMALGYCPPTAKHPPGNCAHVSIENNHHVSVPVIFFFGLHAPISV